jgi:hypothetical protein
MHCSGAFLHGTVSNGHLKANWEEAALLLFGHISNFSSDPSPQSFSPSQSQVFKWINEYTIKKLKKIK